MKVYPTKIYNPVTILGYDGTYLYAIPLKWKGDGGRLVYVTNIIDREITKQMLYYNASLANHAWTERASYTTPTGKIAIVETVMLWMGIPTSGTSLDMKLAYQGRPVVQHSVGSTTPRQNQAWNQTLYLMLPEGSNISLDTQSSDTASREFYGVVMISEINL